MRILMLAPQPFFEPRGTPISVFQRLSALSRLGYEIDLVTYHVGEDVELPNVTIHRTPAVPLVTKVKIGPSLIKPLLDILLLLQAVVLLCKRRYDVIHSHEEASFFAIFLANFFRTYHVYDMHSSLPRQLENFNFGNNRLLIGLFEWLEGLTLRTADVVITVGTDLERLVRQRHPHANLHLIENISLYTGNPPTAEAVQALREQWGVQERPVVVYTGTFETYQGLPMLLESAKIAIRRRPDLMFLLVGGTPCQVDELQAEIDAAGLNENVRLTGMVLPMEALAYTEMANILVSPRIHGTSVPLKIYTYMHAGKPIVATRIQAHTQVITRENAMLVDVDPVAMADSFCRLLDDHELCQRLGRRARHTAQERYSLDNLVAHVSAAYAPLWLPRNLFHRMAPISEA